VLVADRDGGAAALVGVGRRLARRPPQSRVDATRPPPQGFAIARPRNTSCPRAAAAGTARRAGWRRPRRSRSAYGNVLRRVTGSSTVITVGLRAGCRRRAARRRSPPARRGRPAAAAPTTARRHRVGDRRAVAAAGLGDLDRGMPRAAVLGDVGEQFGGAEVRDRLDRRRRAYHHIDRKVVVLRPGRSASSRPRRAPDRAPAVGCRGPDRSARLSPAWHVGAGVDERTQRPGSTCSRAATP